ncbi:hypothetical protein XENORESO_020329, partial [Xenotaenia resolanae]
LTSVPSSAFSRITPLLGELKSRLKRIAFLFFFERKPRKSVVSEEMSHTILLVQPTKRPEGRTYADYESVNECMEGMLFSCLCEISY